VGGPGDEGFGGMALSKAPAMQAFAKIGGFKWPEPVDGPCAGTAAAANGAAASPEAEPQQKRRRLLMDDGQPEPDDTPQPEATPEEKAWQDQWAEVFALMQEGDVEDRAGEYAEAVVALKKNAESLRRQKSTVKSSCEQLLHTAYREALQAHLQAMLEAASAGVSQEVADAADKDVEELVVQAATAPPQDLSAAQLGLIGGTAGSGPAGAGQQPAAPGQAAGPAPQASGPAAQEAAPSCNLWVGGLPEGIDDAMFRTLFGRYGSIASVQLDVNERHGQIQYSAAQEAQAAIDALNGFECGGVKLIVKFAE